MGVLSKLDMRDLYSATNLAEPGKNPLWQGAWEDRGSLSKLPFTPHTTTPIPQQGRSEREHLNGFLHLQAIRWQAGLPQWFLAMGGSHFKAPIPFSLLQSGESESEELNGFLPIASNQCCGPPVGQWPARGGNTLNIPFCPTEGWEQNVGLWNQIFQWYLVFPKSQYHTNIGIQKLLDLNLNFFCVCAHLYCWVSVVLLHWLIG